MYADEGVRLRLPIYESYENAVVRAMQYGPLLHLDHILTVRNGAMSR